MGESAYACLSNIFVCRDIINIDVTVFIEGFHGDTSCTFAVGDVDDMGIELLDVAQEAMRRGVAVCGPGVPIREIGSTIDDYVAESVLTVCREFIGHGIGRHFHLPPDILHFHNDLDGVMKPGMSFTVEPCVNHGSANMKILWDGWTAITKDGARSAQFEHTLLITEDVSWCLQNSAPNTHPFRAMRGLLDLTWCKALGKCEGSIFVDASI